jgi:hypothetical protein
MSTFYERVQIALGQVAEYAQMGIHAPMPEAWDKFCDDAERLAMDFLSMTHQCKCAEQLMIAGVRDARYLSLVFRLSWIHTAFALIIHEERQSIAYWKAIKQGNEAVEYPTLADLSIELYQTHASTCPRINHAAAEERGSQLQDKRTCIIL